MSCMLAFTTPARVQFIFPKYLPMLIFFGSSLCLYHWELPKLTQREIASDEGHRAGPVLQHMREGWLTVGRGTGVIPEIDLPKVFSDYNAMYTHQPGFRIRRCIHAQCL